VDKIHKVAMGGTALMTSTPTLYSLYRFATTLVTPIAKRAMTRKLERQNVDPDRIPERFGHATQPRPDGQLIWFHGASVGESLSVLTLIERLGAHLPSAHFLMTSGTATSADLVGRRLPPRTRHQFAAIDAPAPVNRFLEHWWPDAAIFVESELWPLTLTEAKSRGARLALLNARLSDSSVRNWQKYPDTARFVLNHFSTFITQNSEAGEKLRAMGADPSRIRPGTNLKASSAPLPVDQGTLDQIRGALSGRPVWIASSTHPGEEEEVLKAHRALLTRHPDICLLLAPRHPERGTEVERLIQAQGLTCARRSTGDALQSDTQVYLADTLGEVGTWYALSPIVFLGGSLKPIGGHNPFEPAQAGAGVLTGPGVQNFAETFAAMQACGAAIQVTAARDLETALENWLTNPAALDTARQAASDFVGRQDQALDRVIDTLCQELHLDQRDA
jgi:3-deoxy-D-manno-octulosonic-acid transferase